MFPAHLQRLPTQIVAGDAEKWDLTEYYADDAAAVAELDELNKTELPAYAKMTKNVANAHELYLVMLIYHGSNNVVAEPKLTAPNRYLNFGFGFYTTTNKAQAISFADKVVCRRGAGTGVVSVYEIDEAQAFAACSVLHFTSPDEAWLDFVSDNRSGVYSGAAYDFILCLLRALMFCR